MALSFAAAWSRASKRAFFMRFVASCHSLKKSVSTVSTSCLGCGFPIGEDAAYRGIVGGWSCTGVSLVHGVVGGDVGVGVSAFVAYEQVSCGDVAGQDGGNNLGVSFEGSRGFLSDRRLWRVPNVERGHGTTSRFSTLG